MAGDEKTVAPAEAQVVPAWNLLLSFTRIGALLIGGGYAMLPLLEDEIVRRRKWASADEAADYFAVAQVLPGVIAVNTALLVGYRLRGLSGLVISAAGLVLVPFLLILAYAATYSQVNGLPMVERALAGARPAVAGMILAMGLRMFWRSIRRSWRRA